MGVAEEWLPLDDALQIQTKPNLVSQVTTTHATAMKRVAATE